MIVDHITEAIECLPPRLRAGAYAKVITAIVKPYMTLEAAFDEVGRAYSLLTSKTPLFMLEAIAARFGLLLPPGFSKEEIRVFLPAQAAAVLSSGTWPQVYNVANLLRPKTVPVDALAWVSRVPPDHLNIGIPGLPFAWASVAKQILRQAVRAQDSFDLLTLPTDYFTYDIGPGYDVGEYAPVL